MQRLQPESSESNTGFIFDIANAAAPPAPRPSTSTPISNSSRGGATGADNAAGGSRIEKSTLSDSPTALAELRRFELLQHGGVAFLQHVVVPGQLRQFGFDLGHGFHLRPHVTDPSRRDLQSVRARQQFRRRPGSAAGESARSTGFATRLPRSGMSVTPIFASSARRAARSCARFSSSAMTSGCFGVYTRSNCSRRACCLENELIRLIGAGLAVARRRGRHRTARHVLLLGTPAARSVAGAGSPACAAANRDPAVRSFQPAGCVM